MGKVRRRGWEEGGGEGGKREEERVGRGRRRGWEEGGGECGKREEERVGRGRRRGWREVERNKDKLNRKEYLHSEVCSTIQYSTTGTLYQYA